MSKSIALNIDCMEYMATVPDKYFDLAIVDPPYGGGARTDAEETFNDAVSGRFGGRFEKYLAADTVNAKRDNAEIGTHFHGRGRSKKYQEIYAERTGGTWAEKYDKHIKHWDIAPNAEYFEELARVSKNQIIWGGNYFGLPPTRCFIVWRKLTISENFTMAMAEYAWTSFNDNAKVFEAAPQGKKGDERFHPTQKPVVLYEWLLKNYAKQGDKILDTHLGSGSSRIAAYNLGFDFVGCEIDKEYFEKQEERFAKHTAQTSLFIDGGF